MTSNTAQHEPAEPLVINGLVVPDQETVTHGNGAGNLGAKMGVLFIELSPERSVAVMPVAGNEQPYGFLHGGAYCVLGESLGSVSAALHAATLTGGKNNSAVGIDINATHTASATRGWVTAECRALHLGRSLTVHEIVIANEAGKRCSTVRITNMIRTRR
ncbi:PaaI family thioesterase [Gulosibacter molinativorax]|uniref:Thioesterase n=1 Tax=Gulosibacter molinativorax TaxID=256821 RepID=A0ABT7C7D7_9MICO|nr:hotdog fold thioesterase [Gulosibacter molinativorax]MDJ1371094.1 thioesterase [Gulosibacter molinativorax]QUY61454.1 Proofreading thioesterase EntH [Gulosibacter molinativorax]